MALIAGDMINKHFPGYNRIFENPDKINVFVTVINKRSPWHLQKDPECSFEQYVADRINKDRCWGIMTEFMSVRVPRDFVNHLNSYRHPDHVYKDLVLWMKIHDVKPTYRLYAPQAAMLLSQGKELPKYDPQNLKRSHGLKP